MDTCIEFCIRFWEATRELDLYSMDGSQLDRLIVDSLSKTNGGKELIKTSMNELSVLIRAINHKNRKIQPPSLPSNLESEKPMELEEEINRYLREECSDDDEPGIHEIAEHFAEWGAEHLKK